MADFQHLWQLNAQLAYSASDVEALNHARKWLRETGVVAVEFWRCDDPATTLAEVRLSAVTNGLSAARVGTHAVSLAELIALEPTPAPDASDSNNSGCLVASLGTETTWWGLAVLWLPEAMTQHLSESAYCSESDTLLVGLRHLGLVLVQQQERDQLLHVLQQERERAYEAAHVTRQQRAIATLGQQLQGLGRQRDILATTLHIACTTLELEAAEVSELLPNETVLAMQAVWGWPNDWIDRKRMARHRSLAGYTLSQNQPVVVEDLRVETRFGGAALLHDARVISSISLPLNERLVLAVHSKRLRIFRTSDVEFLVAIASVAKTALERLAAQTEVNAFFDLSHDFLCIASLDGYFKRVNPRFAEMLGYDIENLLAAPFTTWVHPDDREQTEAVLAQMLQGDGTQDFINRYVHTDGSLRWLLWNALPANDGVIYAIATDVTERHFRELALRQIVHATGAALYTAMVRFCTEVMQLDVAIIHALDGDAPLAFVSRIPALEPQRYLPSLCYPVLQARQLCRLPVAEPELQDLGLYYYLGQPILNAEGTVVGVITILAKRPLNNIVVEILQLFAVRTQTELARQAAQSALERLNQSLEIRVTERTAALAKTETRLRTTLDQAVIGIAELDGAGRFMASNPYFNRLLGIDSLAGTLLTDWIKSDHKSGASLKREATAGVDTELCLRHTTGRAVWVRLQLTPVITASETFTLAIAEDITARREAERDLRLYKRSIEASSNGIILVDASQPNFPIIFANPAFERITGYSQADVIGHNCRLLQGRDRNQPGRLALRRALQDQTAGTAEMRNYRKDGSLFWNKVTISPIFDSRGKLTHYLGIQNDITALKQVEAQLQQQITQQYLLEQLTQQVRASLDLDDILQAAVQEMQLVLAADRVLIYRLNSDHTGEAIAEAVAAGQSPLIEQSFEAEIFSEHCPVAYCPSEVVPEQCYANYTQGAVYRLSDTQTEPIVPCMEATIAKFNVRAKLVVPIVQNQVLWGLIIAHQCHAPRVWQEWEVELLQALSAQMAIAIQQSELYQQAQQELAERKRAEAAIEAQLIRERALSQLARQTRQAINAETILAAAVKDIQNLLGAERVIVVRLFEDGHSRVVEEVVEPGFLSVRDGLWPVADHREWPDEDFSDLDLEHYWQGKPRIIQDIGTDCLQDSSQAAEVYAKIAAPILQSAGEDSHDSLRPIADHRWVNPTRGVRLWGLVIVQSCGKPRYWLHSEAELVQQIADQLAIALQQTALFEQLASELQERIQAQHSLEALNDKLTLANLELARATRQKDEFLSMMSHELRTPLNSILGLSEVLQEGVYGSLEVKQAQAVGTIYRSGQHLLELINDILSLAKIEAGKLELHPAEINVTNLCDVCLTFFRQAAQKKGIDLHSELSPIPGLTITADELRLRQALINLLSNAVKFTPTGGSVSLKVEVIPPHIYFRVIDTGIGIDEADQPKLFQAFIQLDSRLNRHYEGTGLGLALVKKIAELHHGSVSVSSQKGHGSTFSLSLPWQESQSTSHVPHSPDAPLTRSDMPLILIADDNEDNVLSITDYLLAHGCRVVSAYDGATAVQMAGSQQPDLVLMDIQMPVLDGIAAITQIHQRYPTLPILALTALTDDTHRDQALTAGARDVLTKPVRLRQLVQTIFAVLPQHTAQ